MRVALKYQSLYTVKIYSIISMKELTKQQLKVLTCVEVYLNKTGFPPTRAEICKELGFKSPNAAEMHLRALEKKVIFQFKAALPEEYLLLEVSNPLSKVVTRCQL